MRAIPSATPTTIVALGDKNSDGGGASHGYAIQYDPQQQHVLRLQFQQGPRGVAGSIPGIYTEDLLAIVEDRLACFQAGPLACDENDVALKAVRAAREALGLRATHRIAKGVLNTNERH